MDGCSAAGRAALSRTAKSCGPDAPTLASSERQHPPTTGAIKPGPRGEHEGNRNTIVQGMPGRFRCTCGRLPCAFYLLHTGLRVLRAPGIPCAFSLKVSEDSQTSGASCRGNIFVRLFEN